MNSRQLNAVMTVMVAGLAIGLAACDDPVGEDGAPKRVTGKVWHRSPDTVNDGQTCNRLWITAPDGSPYDVCVSNGDFDRHPIGTTYSRG